MDDSSPRRIGAVRAAAAAALLLSFFGHLLARKAGNVGVHVGRGAGVSRGRQTASCEGGVAALAGAVANGKGNGVLPLGARANFGSRWQRWCGKLWGADGAEPEGVDRRLTHTAPPIARSGVSKGTPEDVAEFETVLACKGGFPAPLSRGKPGFAGEDLVRQRARAAASCGRELRNV